MRGPARLCAGAAGLVLSLAILLALTAVWTARPGDPALYPPSGEAATVALVSHGWHSGLVLPRAALTGPGSGTALRALALRFRAYDSLEFGWGEAGFYRATPTVRDLDWRLAMRALFTPGGSEGVVQVIGLQAVEARALESEPDDLPAGVRAAFPRADIVPVRLSPAGLARLVARLDGAFALEGGQPIDRGAGLYGPSRFFAGTGRFSWANLCNHWSAGLLNAAGLPVAPVLATLPPGLILDLGWRSGLRPLPAP